MPIGTSWESGSWQDSVWVDGSWADSPSSEIVSVGSEFTIPTDRLQFTVYRDDYSMSSGTAPQRPTMVEGEIRSVTVSFVGKLDQNELLTGTPVVTSDSPSLTCSSPQVSTETLVVNSKKVRSGRAAQFTLSDGIANQEYIVTVQCDTTLGQTLIGRCVILVES